MAFIREVTIDKTKIIGKGMTGAVYQNEKDSIIKLYHRNARIDDIEQEMKYSRSALVHGIPTAISLGLVQDGKQFGLEYELINSKTIGKEIMENPDKLDFFTQQYVDVAKLLHTSQHNINGKGAEFQSTKHKYHKYIAQALYFTKEERELCHKLVDSVPDRDTFVHGDLHTKNIMWSNGEIVLIDMADISYGHPIFEFGPMFQIFKMGEFGVIKNLSALNGFLKASIGMDLKTSDKVWDLFFKKYFPEKTDEELKEIYEQARIFGLLRLALCPILVPNIGKARSLISRRAARKQLFPYIKEKTLHINW